MTARTFVHAVTGRSIRVADGSRTERLVEADDNWTEHKAGGAKSSPQDPIPAGEDEAPKPRRRSPKK